MPKKSLLSEAKMSVIAPGHTRPGTTLERRTQNTRDVPATGPAYLQAAIQLLLIEPGSLAMRSLEMCDEAATMLMEEAEALTAHAPTSTTKNKPSDAEDGDDFSPRETAADEAPTDGTRKQDAPHTKRLEATYLLMAGAVSGMGAHGVEGAAGRSLQLAQRAMALFPTPMTQVTLALSCYGMRHVLPLFQPSAGKPSEDLPAIIVALAQTAITSLSKPSTLLQEEQCYYARALWLLALLGHVDDIAEHVNHLIAMNPTNYLGLLLLSMVQTMNGDNSAALVAALHVEEHYAEDPCAAAVTALLRQAERQPNASGAPPTTAREDAGEDGAGAGIDEELGVALARTSTFSDVARDLDDLTNRKTALKALCLHCAPGEESATTLHLSATELKRRAAGHWLLLAHVATRAGVFSVAELALESLLTYLAKHRQFHSAAYASALTSYALLILARRLDQVGDQLSSSVARLVHAVVRPLKAQAQRQAPPQRCAFGLASAAASAGLPSAPVAALSASGEKNANDIAARAGVDSTWRSNALFAQNCLDKAAQVAPYQSDAYIGLGTLKLLDAAQPELSAEDRDAKLLEASSAFMRAVQCAPTRSAAYMGMGCALEAQGAMEESLDFYAAAAELSACEPLIALDFFVYMFE